MDNKNFNPMACYAYLANAGVCADNVDHFVAGLKRYIANDPPIVFTPCPIVYFEPSHKQFFVLPFLCLRVPQNKVWGIRLGALFIRTGFDGPMTIEVAKKLLQREQEVVLGADSKRRIQLPAKEEMERILAYDVFNNHWKTIEIMKANGISCDASCFSSLNAYAILKDEKTQEVAIYDSYSDYLDEVVFEKTLVRAPEPDEKVYALQVLQADFSADKVGKVDEYGFPDAETAKILSVLMETN